jgi:hypothetical protein
VLHDLLASHGDDVYRVSRLWMQTKLLATGFVFVKFAIAPQNHGWLWLCA